LQRGRYSLPPFAKTVGCAVRTVRYARMPPNDGTACAQRTDSVAPCDTRGGHPPIGVEGRRTMIPRAHGAPYPLRNSRAALRIAAACADGGCFDAIGALVIFDCLRLAIEQL